MKIFVQDNSFILCLEHKNLFVERKGIAYGLRTVNFLLPYQYLLLLKE